MARASHSRAWFALVALSLLAAGAVSRPSSGHESSQPSLDTINVEARRQHETLRHEVDRFISSVTVPGFDESVAKWHLPICPLVAGLPRELGEFILQRISQAARDATAPLAAEECQANFLIVVTSEPNALLQRWVKRNPAAFNEDRGLAAFNRFLNSQRPVRVWYNASSDCFHEMAGGLGTIAIGGTGAGLNALPTCRNGSTLGSRLNWQTVRAITSAIVIADAQRVTALNIGQLADYVAMVGLAEIRLDRNPGPVPSILRLFADASETRPQSMSNWDASFLKSLYSSPSRNIMQVSIMQTKMLGYVAP